MFKTIYIYQIKGGREQELKNLGIKKMESIQRTKPLACPIMVIRSANNYNVILLLLDCYCQYEFKLKTLNPDDKFL